MALVIGTVSSISPVTTLNVLTTKAYASTNDESTLDSLELYDHNGNIIRLYEDNDYKDSVDDDEVEEDETYYAKTSSKIVNIDISGPSDKYVKVFNGTSDSKKGKDVDRDITLSDDSSTNTIVIKIYGEDTDDDTVRNNDDDDDEFDLLNTYKIKIKHVDGEDTEDTEDTGDVDYDAIYLDRLSVSGYMINLSDSKLKYIYNVDSDVEDVIVRATPEDDDYDVTIDGKDADDDDKFKATVSLDKGENDIKIEIQDNNKERVYTLVINRGAVSTTSSTSTATDTDTIITDNTTAKSQWVKTNGVWQYNDETGTPARNIWVQNYYLQDNGDMATGWLGYNGDWYYLGTDGAAKTGWQSIDGNWYYLDSQGQIQIGWFKDLNGKWYYLNSYGAMAYNTTIDGYKLGTNGAWTGK
jgi:hypothetical protein